MALPRRTSSIPSPIRRGMHSRGGLALNRDSHHRRLIIEPLKDRQLLAFTLWDQGVVPGPTEGARLADLAEVHLLTPDSQVFFTPQGADAVARGTTADVVEARAFSPFTIQFAALEG